jgi:hypothetical protein
MECIVGMKVFLSTVSRTDLLQYSGLVCTKFGIPVQIWHHWVYFEKFWRAHICIFAVIVIYILIWIGPSKLQSQIQELPKQNFLKNTNVVWASELCPWAWEVLGQYISHLRWQVFSPSTVIITVTHLPWIDSIGFWRWCATLINTGFLDFAHRPEFYN